MQRSAVRVTRSRPTGSSGASKVASRTVLAKPAQRSAGVVTVSIPRSAKLDGLKPKLFRLHIERALRRIATLPDEQVEAELERVEGELTRARPIAGDTAGTLALDPVLERAFQRGDETRAAWATRADLLSGEAFAAAVGLSRATVDNRRRAGQLLALELGAKRGVRYPAWQRELLAEASSRASFERVLGALGAVPSTSSVRFFTQTSPALGGRTPVDALKSGDAAAVLRAAKTWARGEQGGA